MITRVFSTNRVYIFAFIPIVLLILRAGSVFNAPPVLESGQLPWISELFSYANQIPGLNLILTVVIITIQSYYLARICDQQHLFQHSSNLPGFILAINYSLFYAHHYLSPVLVANLFLILALQRILSVYNQATVAPVLFRAGLYIGIAAVFYKPSMFFFLIITYQLVVFRTFNWREHLVPFLAMIIPVLYLYSYYFLLDDNTSMYNWLILEQGFFIWDNSGVLFWLAPIAALLMTLMALAYIFSTSLKRTIRINNLYKVLFITFALSGLLILVFQKDIYSVLMLCLPALSIMQAYYLLGVNKSWVRESMVYLLIGFILIRELNLI